MNEGLLAVLAGVERIGLPWMLGGSVASMCYGEPRMTLDADCIIAARPRHSARIVAAFPEADFYVPPEVVIIHELQRGGQGCFNVIHQHSGFKADLYPAGEDLLIAWGLERRRMLEVAGRSVPVAPPEYVVVMKLRYFALSAQEKHLRDIRSLIRIHRACDHQMIGDWAGRYGVDGAWRLVLATGG